MTHRTVKRPEVSVLLAVHDAEDLIARCVESVLSQSLRDIEVIIVDLTSTDHTPHLLDRFVDRDFRVDVLSCETGRIEDGLATAIEAARGERLLLLDQADWLSPDYLDQMLAAARERSCELVIPFTPREDAPRSARLQLLATDAELHHGAVDLLAEEVLESAFGMLADASLMRAAAQSTTDPGLLALDLFDRASCVAVLETSSLHRDLPVWPGPLDPARYERCERQHERLLALFAAWGLAADEESMTALHRHHLVGVIRCIENACLGAGHLSSIERRQRVQDMIDDHLTRDSIEALRSSSGEFGLMFAPIARRSAAACFLGARIRGVVGRVFAPWPFARPFATLS